MVYYRTYRPQKLSDIDNESRRILLTKLIADPANLSHAFLLIGPKGTGKTSTARIIAKVVNCEQNVYAQKNKEIEPCGTCDSCVAIARGMHLDVHELDGASNRGVDDVRTLRDEIRFAPSQGRYKVYIIDEVHMLTKEAFNALLKTLEEPPKNTLFILATTEEMRIPATIMSRAVTIRFTKATDEELFDSLQKITKKEKIELSDEVLEKIAHAAQGSFRDGAKLLEVVSQTTDGSPEAVIQSLSQGVAVTASDLVELLIAKKTEEAVRWVELFSNNGGNASWLIQTLAETVRERILSQKYKAERATYARLSKMLVLAFEQTRYSPVADLPLLMGIISSTSAS